MTAQAEPQRSLIRWLWDRGLGTFLLATTVIVAAIIYKPLTGADTEEWLSSMAIAAGGVYFVRAAMLAGPKNGDNS